jgi:intein/homing endonuclease
MAFKKKEDKTPSTSPSGHPRNWTPEQRRNAFCSARKNQTANYQILESDFKETLIPYNHIVLDHVLGLKGIARHGSVTQFHGDEGAGKCLSINNLVITPNGVLYVDEVFSQNGLEATCSSKTTPVCGYLINRDGIEEGTTEFTHNGRRPTFAVKTASGNQITTTSNHPSLVMNKAGYWVWRKTEEIRQGDYLVTSRAYQANVGKKVDISDDELYFYGVLLADGCFTENKVQVTNNDPIVKETITKVGSTVLGVEPHEYDNNSEGSINYHFNSKDNVTQLYAKMGWESGIAKDKQLGTYIRQLSSDQICMVLQGYFDCECSIDASGIEVSSASWKLLYEVKTLLQAHFGIISILKSKEVSAYPDNSYWRLSLYGAAALEYQDKIGFRSEVRRKEALVLDNTKTKNPNLDVIPNCGMLLESLYDSFETTREHNFAVRDYKGDTSKANPSYQALEEILGLNWNVCAQYIRLQEILKANYYYDEVVEVVALEPEPTFDFVLPSTHSFHVANIITHNTSSTLCAAAAYQQATGEPIAIFDYEGTSSPAFAAQCGIDTNLLFFMQPSSVQDAIAEHVRLMDELGVRLFVNDSIPFMDTKVDKKLIYNGKAFKGNYGSHAKTISTFYKMLRPYTQEYDASLMMVNQTRDRIDDSTEASWATKYSYTNRIYTLPGGRMARFAPSVMVELTLEKALAPKEIGDMDTKELFILDIAAPGTKPDPTMNLVRARTLKNKPTGAGFRKGDIYLRPGKGWDDSVSVLALARSFGFIVNSGAKWFVGKTKEDAFATYPNKTEALEALVVKRDAEVIGKLRSLVTESLCENSSMFNADVSKEELDFLDESKATTFSLEDIED